MIGNPFAPEIEETWYSQLQSEILGKVIAPDEPQYDEVRKAWSLTVDHRPLLIVVPESASDIVSAVRFANTHGLRIAVQATGHGVGRPADGHTLLINTSKMTEVRVNHETRTAVVEAGATWKPVLEAAHEYGLAPLLGSSPDVGAVGYTLGGGMGWLARKYGMAVDSVNWFEVVTPDGRLVRASANQNADLFWGLRGGGGNFGVVTAMGIKLYPVRTIYGGSLIYPAAVAKEALARFREWVKANPDELTSSIALFNFPPLPQIPELLRGKSVVMIRGAYVGSPEDGADRVQPWLDWQTPIANTWHEMPFSQVETISNDPKDPSAGFSAAVWIRELTDEAIETIVRYVQPADAQPTLVFAEIRHAGGAIARVDSNANAYSNRDGQLVMQMVGMAPTPEAHQRVKDHIEAFKAELQPALTGKIYLNLNEGELQREHAVDGYSAENYLRLQSLKTQYDGANRFDHSFDIPTVTQELEPIR
jgi:FAD/FMN-containing dehydrogenase